MAMNSFSRSDTYPTSTIVSSFAGNYPYKSTNVNGQNPSKYFDNINTDRIVASILMRLTLALFSLIKFRSDFIIAGSNYQLLNIGNGRDSMAYNQYSVPSYYPTPMYTNYPTNSNAGDNNNNSAANWKDQCKGF